MSKALAEGDKASITHVFTEADVRNYADLIGDKNPVHVDAAFAAETQFGERIVHGMLVGGLFSTLLGEHLPGHGAIYMEQNMKFKAPVFFNVPVTAQVEITKIREGKPIVFFECSCHDDKGTLLIEGSAVMYVPWLKK